MMIIAFQLRFDYLSLHLYGVLALGVLAYLYNGLHRKIALAISIVPLGQLVCNILDANNFGIISGVLCVVALLYIMNKEISTSNMKKIQYVVLLCLIFCVAYYLSNLTDGDYNKETSSFASSVGILLFFCTLCLYFVNSYKDTQDKTLKRSLGIAVLGCFGYLAYILFFYYSVIIVISENQNYEVSYIYYGDFEKFNPLIICAGLAITQFFFVLLRKSQNKLSYICVPGLLGFAGQAIFMVQQTEHLGYEAFFPMDNEGYQLLYTVSYLLIALSFYKLQISTDHE